MISKDREKEIARQMGVSVPSLRRMWRNIVVRCGTCGTDVKILEMQASGCPVCKESEPTDSRPLIDIPGTLKGENG